jgi:hypothetical protein
MSGGELFSLAWAPLARRLRIALLRYRIEWKQRERLMLLKQADNDRLAAQIKHREACILQADLNLLERRK